MQQAEAEKLKSLKVFDSLTIGPVRVEKRKVVAPYTVKINGTTDKIDLIYLYDEDVFDTSDDSSMNLASLIASQLAINYGMFCSKIIFIGLFDNADKRFIKDAMENTAREIYVKKFLEDNLFLVGDAKNLPVVKLKSYLQAELIFESRNSEPVNTKWEFWKTHKSKVCILSSGGKDSLLSYGIMDELEYETHPIFVNESGRHWFTALNSFRFFRDNVKNTSRVWINSDRIYNFMLRRIPFIRKDFANVRADEYPIRLWTVAVFLFGVLPLMKKRGISRLIIGDEYDTTNKTQYQGITHYDGLFDQSKYFDETLSRYYMKKGWAVAQFSILRPLSELMIQTILTKRYPHLQKHQVSCHAAHQKDDRIYPCGKCEKCRRIVGMLTAMDSDPRDCGYKDQQIDFAIKSLATKVIHQEEAGAEHLLFMLNKKGSLELPAEKLKNLKEHTEILNLRFDSEHAPFDYIPSEFRKRLYKIYLEYVEGALLRVGRKWEKFDLLNHPQAEAPYPFEFDSSVKKHDMMDKDDVGHDKYVWAEMTWEEAGEKLKIVDIALLPVGAIEQHGPHLTLDTDAFDADYLAKKVAEACSFPKPFVLPLIPYGVSYHHDDFPGTISVSNETLSKMVYEIGLNLARQGIKKLIIINGHGDNSPTLNFAAQMINRDAKIFVAVDTGETSDVDLDEITSTPNDVHAGEIETSTSLAVRPELVKMDKAQKSVLNFTSRYLNFSSLRGIPWYAQTKKISESGTMGDPTKATSKKGKRMWEIMIAHLVGLVEDLKGMSLDEIHQKKL